MLFGDPQADVGAAGEKVASGWSSKLRQLVGRAGREPAAPPAPVPASSADRWAGAAPQRLAREGGLRPALARAQAAPPRDRAVAGAAAEVPRQRVVDGPRVGGAPRPVVREEASSRSPACRSRTGSRACPPSPAAPDAGAVRPPQALHREQGLPVEHRQEQDAGIHRRERDLPSARVAQDHRAGAAVALGAAFLRAGAARSCRAASSARSAVGSTERSRGLAVQQESHGRGAMSAAAIGRIGEGLTSSGTW